MKKHVVIFGLLLMLFSCEKSTEQNSNKETVSKISFSQTGMTGTQTIQITERKVLFNTDFPDLNDSCINFSELAWSDLLNSFSLDSFFVLRHYYYPPLDTPAKEDLGSSIIEIKTNYRTKKVEYAVSDSTPAMKIVAAKLYLILMKFETW